MFAKATCMTRVILVLITRERKTMKYVAKGGRIRMTQASMPKSTPVARATGVTEVVEVAE